jgi:hypothetical protein
MFSPNDIHSSPHTSGLRAALSERVRDAFALTIAFLTLEDGYEPDWDQPDMATTDHGTRPPACEGRIRQPQRTAVESPWISA